jgi:SAM-dependent methyltransferase
MSARRRQAVQRYHDRVAGRYDAIYDDPFWQWHDALTWSYLKPYLPRDLSAPTVDLGCGTGQWGARLFQSGFSVTFVDISAGMLDQARAKIAVEGSRSTRGAFLRADLCELSAIPDQTFSFALALGEPIGCAHSPPRALREIRRILKDDGVLVATLDNRYAAIEHYLAEGDPRRLAEFLREGTTHWLTREKAEQFLVHTYTPRQARRLLEVAGFEVLEIRGKTVLPMRAHRHLLSTALARREWARLERRLSLVPAAVGRAPHLQVAARRPPPSRIDHSTVKAPP